MEMSKQTYKRISIFINVARVLLSQGDGENKLAKDHKLAYALRKVIPRCNEAMQDYNEQIEDLDNEFASTDKDGNVLRDELGYKFTKENQKKRTEKVRVLFKTGEADVPQYIATEVPDWLPENVVEAFQGFVVKKVTDESV